MIYRKKNGKWEVRAPSPKPYICLYLHLHTPDDNFAHRKDMCITFSNHFMSHMVFYLNIKFSFSVAHQVDKRNLIQENLVLRFSIVKHFCVMRNMMDQEMQLLHSIKLCGELNNYFTFMQLRTEASLCIFKHLFKFYCILVFLCIRFVELDGIIKQQVYISTKSINVLIFICFKALLIE